MGRIGKVVFAGLITAAVLLSVVTQDDTIGKASASAWASRS
jgi:hypothetical protein